jgi:hypothetical protein
MKALLSILIIISAQAVWAAEKPAPTAAATANVSGYVLEVKDAGVYTYLRLKTADGETWAAISKAPVKKGAKVTIENVMVMNNFESKSLKQTFKSIVFGTLAGAGSTTPKAGHASGMAHPATAGTADTADIRVTKATGANAWTVAEIITKSAELKDKPVVVRGKIVKYNPGIMGKNWLHLRDGTGAAAENTHDILVTTQIEAKLGDVVTIKGTARTDRDFGSGDAYKILIEDATIQK